MKQIPNVIIYYCNDDLHVFEVPLSFASSENICTHVYFKVKEHSESIGLNGQRHDIKFVDFSCHKYIAMQHMWPLEEHPIMILSEDEEQEIINMYNAYIEQ